MKKARCGIACLAAALALPCAAQSQDVPPAKPGSAPARAVAFKQEEDFAAPLARIGVGLVLALGVGAAALAGYKRLGPLPLAVRRTPGARRLLLRETLRLGPKTALFLVELDGKTLLIGQTGESLALLERATPPDAR